jgi:hypothetical protein
VPRDLAAQKKFPQQARPNNERRVRGGDQVTVSRMITKGKRKSEAWVRGTRTLGSGETRTRPRGFRSMRIARPYPLTTLGRPAFRMGNVPGGTDPRPASSLFCATAPMLQACHESRVCTEPQGTSGAEKMKKARRTRTGPVAAPCANHRIRHASDSDQ